ncbi:glycoside hydrolase family 108 protein [Duganella phyllosphaerae]|uniref:Putative peptidoglycan domain protein n=1 Tax=Duganella phyllosphaerae TaxID=762836 RepID=A0A1E7WJQ9_9BURK|nr:glycosyl hydrolase 108 family protein [Duganella phyllosphaerae]OEZ98761.1 putative peptidoglycan domain protein [Duganella phyllosphaerae]
MSAPTIATEFAAIIKGVIDAVLRAEGGYVNDAADRGGETNFGITVAVARANGYTGAMRDMPEAVARAIYTARYIAEPKFDKVLAIHAGVAAELIDTGINMGPHRAAEFLQRCLNGFNDTGARYAPLFVDGRLGELSLGALAAFLKWRGQEGALVLLRALNGVQTERYLAITEANTTQRRFLYGWIKERVAM